MATRGRKLVREIELEACTLGVAAEEFYRHNKIEGLAKATQSAYKDYVGAFVKWCGADTPADTIRVRNIERYLEYKLEGGCKQVTAATIAKHLRRFINFSISREYMYYMEIKIPKYEVEQKEPYTDEEMRKLLVKPKSNNWVEYRNWVMVNYFFSTGQRLGTVLNIKVEHLDLDEGRVWLEHNKDKIKKYMPLSTAIIRILREYIELSDLQEQDYLFPEYEGKQLKERGAEDAIRKYNHSRGVEKTSIHLFRHTFAKNYIMNGGNPMKLQKLLNHKTIDMTMRYVNLYGNDISKDLDLFNPLDNFKRANYTETKRRKIG